MAMALKVEIITRETIKPSSPTPQHLRSFKISLLDQLAPVVYSPSVLFYSFYGDDDSQAKAAERSQQLKTSLSATLTRFYPLAGRIEGDVSIDCNDEGVDYLEARVNCRISDILGQPKPNVMNQFLPIDIVSTEAITGCLLLVQVNFFECGGMAIGVCISHKITDAASLGIFLKGWATTALESSEVVVLPEFNAASVLPPRDFSITLPAVKLTTCKCITRRCVFDASKIAALKAKAASTSVPQPTRVEAVSAFIWKCAMTASRSNLGSPRPSVLAQIVNMRKRVAPLQENSFGNLVVYFAVKTEEISEIELRGLVGQLRKGVEDFRNDYVKKLGGNEGYLTICESFKEAGNLLKRDDIDFYSFSSCVRFPLYETDFGWGRPTWVSITSSAIKNVVILMDTREGDGIEAWVTLKEEDMTVFERDHELLACASLDPSVLI